jgi:Lrp/AsnC family leucine-responsive transcriptional regulator
MTSLDSRDRKILNLLQDNGRLTNADLAELVNLSPSASLRRTRILEDSGLVSGYVMLLDPRAAGVAGVAFVSVTLQSQGRPDLEKFERAVVRLPEIQECYLLAGEYDYLLKVAYRDAAHLENIHTETLTQLPGVVRVHSTLTLRTVKRTTKIPI